MNATTVLSFIHMEQIIKKRISMKYIAKLSASQCDRFNDIIRRAPSKPVTCEKMILALNDFISSSNLTKLLVSPQQIALQVNSNGNFGVKPSRPLDIDTEIEVLLPDTGLVDVFPQSFTIPAHNTSLHTINVLALSAKSEFFLDFNCTQNVTECPFDFSESFVRLTVVHSLPLSVVIQIFGWIYFIAWSISFYPQIFLNYKRKSVVGLNFDFLALNLTGFIFYSLFNCSLFWIPTVEAEYIAKHPRGIIPVQSNDVVFALHAAFACFCTVVQCFIYERGGQKISYPAIALLVIDWSIALICLIITGTSPKYLQWLDFFNILSYLKLSITLIKYIPQAFFNYRRKSTVGWSIGNILLDFTGGSTSLLQMFLLAYNNSDFPEIMGDFTKFGLGLISLLFDLLFMFQHYVLYRASVPYETFASENLNSPPVTSAENNSESDPVVAQT